MCFWVGFDGADPCVRVAAAVLFGVLGGTVCNFATQLKFYLHYDDALDIFAVHTIGGIVGNVRVFPLSPPPARTLTTLASRRAAAQILTGLFAQSSVAGFDGIALIPGGWLDRHYIQLGYQIADSMSGMAYSFVLTTIILWIMHYIPGLRMRTTEEAEVVGMDDYDMGEFAYDYVGLEADLGVRDVEGGLRKELENHTDGGREPRHHVVEAASSAASDEEKRV